jgi:hypothetical protein
MKKKCRLVKQELQQTLGNNKDMKMLAGKPYGKRQLRRHSGRWDNDIKSDFLELRNENVNTGELFQVRVKVMMKFLVL